ncbi:hypothetical protein ACIQY8_14625 [Streptomyces albidoflavus]
MACTAFSRSAGSSSPSRCAPLPRSAPCGSGRAQQGQGLGAGVGGGEAGGGLGGEEAVDEAEQERPAAGDGEEARHLGVGEVEGARALEAGGQPDRARVPREDGFDGPFGLLPVDQPGRGRRYDAGRASEAASGIAAASTTPTAAPAASRARIAVPPTRLPAQRVGASVTGHARPGTAPPGTLAP